MPIPIPDYDDDKNGLEEADLELLAEYLEGRMTDGEEREFENRLATDRAFRVHVRPILRECYNSELLPIEIEIGTRLAQCGLIRMPAIERPRRRSNWRRRLERKRRRQP